MSFVELGAPPFRESADPRQVLLSTSEALKQRVEQQLASIGEIQRNPAFAGQLGRGLSTSSRGTLEYIPLPAPVGE
jgi:hypothetical protein